MYHVHKEAIPEGHEIRHKCDNPACINPDHLETGTHTENMRDMVERGRRKPTTGADNPKAKLSAKDVIDILNRFNNGDRQIDIARQFNVTKHCIYGIVHGKKWKNIQKGGIQ
jgi:DNA invertase Pin-like site-specific DNA recombinase